MRKIFSVPLNPKLNEQQFVEFYNFLATYKDYIRDVYFTSRIKPFMQDAMGDVFILEEYHRNSIEAALFIQKELGIPEDRFNIHGGAIALGNAIGASGAILLGMLLEQLEQTGSKTGLTAITAEGGIGVATLIERL